MERWNRILNLLADEKKIEVARLAQILEVSQVTIRKDLMQLEQKGIVQREHGYAMLNQSDDMNHRLAYHYETKQKIAQLAISQVQDHETVMIESGSCCALVASALVKERKDVTIITNSAFIADYVRKEGNARIVLLGGEYQKESQVNVGPILRRCLDVFYVDKLFIGTDGFSEVAGFTGSDYMRGEAVRDMAQHAKNVIVVSESEKFGKQSLVKLLDLDQITEVVTDFNIPEDYVKILEEKQIKVVKTKM